MGREKRPDAPIKDDLPLNTIHRVRNILNRLGVLLVEDVWFNNLDAIHSCRITLPGLDIGTNGKGLSREYALAGAYAEFMERMQNFWLFPGMEMNPESLWGLGFRYDPFEKLHSPGDLPSLPEDFQKSRLIPGQDKTLYDEWEAARKTLSANGRAVPFVPFYSLRNSDIEYLPWDFLQHLYWSNGMCAGNSPEEALSQGLSEILERYAVREIWHGNITPPTIPPEALQESVPRLYGLIKDLERSGNLTVIVKDCSLNQGLPVVGVIFLFNQSHTYCVRIGADPFLPIALERCLTEFLQGKQIRDFPSATPLDLAPPSDRISNPEDFGRFILGDAGRFPNSFFDSDFSYAFSGFPAPQITSHRDKLRFLLDLIEGMNHNIYIRDVSFLGFDTYCVIVPGLSEHLTYSELRWEDLKRRRFTDFSKIRLLSRMKTIPETAFSTLAADMESRIGPAGKRGDLLLSEYVGFPCTEETHWNRLSLNLLLSMIKIRLGRFEEAHGHLSRFLAHAREEKESPRVQFYFVLNQFLALLAQGRKDLNQAAAILGPLLGEAVVKKVKSLFYARNEIFRHLPLPAEWDCGRCQISPTCHYPEIEKFYLTLKEALKKNPRDQKLLGDLLAATGWNSPSPERNPISASDQRPVQQAGAHF